MTVENLDRETLGTFRRGLIASLTEEPRTIQDMMMVSAGPFPDLIKQELKFFEFMGWAERVTRQSWKRGWQYLYIAGFTAGYDAAKEEFEA